MCINKNTEKIEIIECLVLENIVIASSMYRMKIGGEKILKTCGQARPGEFINIYLKDKSTLLPRPISLCYIGNEHIEIVYKVVGKGTKELSKYEKGERIKISENLGNGYHIDERYKGKKTVLIGGGAGIPPMLELARKLKKVGSQVTMIAGYNNETFLIEDFEKTCENLFVATERGISGYKGNIAGLINKEYIMGDEFFSCGPKPMLKFVAEYCDEKNIPLQVSLEERMGCGFGACVGCAIEILENGKKVKKSVCKDGPVFKGKEVIWNE